jgi:hypothetical protein
MEDTSCAMVRRSTAVVTEPDSGTNDSGLVYPEHLGKYVPTIFRLVGELSPTCASQGPDRACRYRRTSAEYMPD